VNEDNFRTILEATRQAKLHLIVAYGNDGTRFYRLFKSKPSCYNQRDYIACLRGDDEARAFLRGYMGGYSPEHLKRLCEAEG
jgi:hypothetical protein